MGCHCAHALTLGDVCFSCLIFSSMSPDSTSGSLSSHGQCLGLRWGVGEGSETTGDVEGQVGLWRGQTILDSLGLVPELSSSLSPQLECTSGTMDKP